MRCAFCGNEFDEEAAETACRGCAIFGGCKKVRCPHCGYESPREPRLIRWLRKRKGKTHVHSGR